MHISNVHVATEINQEIKAEAQKLRNYNTIMQYSEHSTKYLCYDNCYKIKQATCAF